MKKITQILLMVFTVILLTGCVKAEYHLTVNKDGSATLANTMGISNEMYGMVATSGDPFADSKKDLEAEGYTITKYKDDSYTGITATKEFESLEKITLNSGNEEVGDVPFTVEKEKGLFATVYKVKGVLDLTQEEEVSNEATSEEAEEEGVEIEGLDGFGDILSQADMTFKLTTPSELKVSNATSTDAETNTSTWELTAGEENEISFEMAVPNVALLIVAIGLAVVIVLVLVLLVVLKRRRA